MLLEPCGSRGQYVYRSTDVKRKRIQKAEDHATHFLSLLGDYQQIPLQAEEKQIGFYPVNNNLTELKLSNNLSIVPCPGNVSFPT